MATPVENNKKQHIQSLARATYFLQFKREKNIQKKFSQEFISLLLLYILHYYISCVYNNHFLWLKDISGAVHLRKNNDKYKREKKQKAFEDL